MGGVQHVVVAGEELELYPQKAIFWRKNRILLIADLHLGKINHFRKAGIALPPAANTENIELLVTLIQVTKPQRLIFLGDLFHSYYNEEWEVFGQVIQHFPDIKFELVQGNHDVMSDLQYARKGIHVTEALDISPFIMTHHPMQEVDSTRYNLAGHLHPGVMLQGKGRQRVTLPCFYFGKHQGLLPAFGVFTGLAKIKPHKEDKVFVIANHKIVCVS